MPAQDNLEDYEDLFFTFKLTSGDTIVCQVLRDSEKTVIIRDPFQVMHHVVMQDGAIHSMTYYAEWFVSASNRTHMIRKEHILSAAIPSEKLKREYVNLIKKKVTKEATVKAQTQTPPKKKSDWTGLDFDLGKQQDRFDLN